MFADELYLFLLPISSFLLTVLLVPPIRHLAIRLRCISLPTGERWHRRPTPSLGGGAFFLGFFLPVLFFPSYLFSSLPLAVTGSQMFILGICDDLRRLNPATKLMGQIIAAASAIFFGYSLHFFTWPLLDTLLTALWIVGLTNAVNLLDNMDGLASGIGLIAALYLALLFMQRGDLQHSCVALAFAGAITGFLIYNLHPASIFMGDSGSLFLGSMLSLLTLDAQGQASNIFSLVAVPTLILLVPIFDTSLVAFTRVLRGQSISQGGKDHASHRLVVLGLAEPKAVFLLYVMATIAGATALLIERLSYTLSLVLVPFIVLSFALFTAYLAQVEVVSEEEGKRRVAESKLPALLIALTYKRRLLEVILDSFLISFAYYLAFVLRFDFHLDAGHLRLYLTSLPLVLTASYGAFFFFGIYHRVWRYIGFEDLLHLAKAVISGALLAALAVLFMFRFTGHSRVVFILYALLLLLSMAASRLSFRFFALLLARLRADGPAVLIYGAGDGGELVVREWRKNPKVGYRPLGFLDDDPRKQGRTIFGLPVLGGLNNLVQILRQEPIQGLIISSRSISANGNIERVRALCGERNIWVRRLQFELIEEYGMQNSLTGVYEETR